MRIRVLDCFARHSVPFQISVLVTLLFVAACTNETHEIHSKADVKMGSVSVTGRSAHGPSVKTDVTITPRAPESMRIAACEKALQLALDASTTSLERTCATLTHANCMAGLPAPDCPPPSGVTKTPPAEHPPLPAHPIPAPPSVPNPDERPPAPNPRRPRNSQPDQGKPPSQPTIPPVAPPLPGLGSRSIPAAQCPGPPVSRDRYAKFAFRSQNTKCIGRAQGIYTLLPCADRRTSFSLPPATVRPHFLIEDEDPTMGCLEQVPDGQPTLADCHGGKDTQTWLYTNQGQLINRAGVTLHVLGEQSFCLERR